MNGFQSAAVFNYTGKNMSGAQLGGAASITEGTFGGFQGAGVFNITGESFGGCQLAGAFNIAQGSMSGFQGAGVFNYTGGAVAGAQLSMVNIAGDVAGAQVGVVNIAKKVDGVQIGLFNIAEENTGLAIGLFSYSKNGIHDFEIWHDTGNFSQVAFKFGTKYFYSIVLGGYNFVEENDWLWNLGFGIGAHLPVGRFFLDIDVLASKQFEESLGWDNFFSIHSLLPRMRLKGGFSIFRGFSIFAGVELQMYHPYLYYRSDLVEDFIFELPVDDMAETCKFVPRFFIGIQIF
jgi:hypothetical protein